MKPLVSFRSVSCRWVQGCALVAGLLITTISQAQISLAPAGNRILMGAFVDRDWTESNPCGDKITSPGEWADNKQWYGNAGPYFGKIFPEVFRPDGSKNWFYLWEAEIDKIKAQGRVPYINLEFHGELALHDNSKCWWRWNEQNQRVPHNIIAEILSGQHNDIIDNIAWGLKSKQVPVLIDLFHEANGNWYDWSPCKHNETWARFREAYKYVVNRFRAVGATNVSFTHSLWAVNYGCQATTAGDPGINDIYIPGYMNWMGIDIYSGGSGSFAAEMSTWYDRLASTGLPLAIGEMGVASGDGKLQWMTGFRDDLINRFPAVKAFNWFDINKPGEANWRIDSDAGSGPHFSNLMKDTHYVGGFGTYELKNKASGKCLDVSGASTSNGANIQVYSCNGSNAQTFIMTDLTGYNMELRALNSGKCVDVAAAGMGDGTNVQQYSCNASAAQTWNMHVISWSPLEVELVASHSGKCLDVDSGVGPNVQQWWCSGGSAQRFVLTKR